MFYNGIYFFAIYIIQIHWTCVLGNLIYVINTGLDKNWLDLAFKEFLERRIKKIELHHSILLH